MGEQDQDLGSLPRFRTARQPQPSGWPGDQEEHEPQAHDRWSSRPDAGTATLLVSAVDRILDTHKSDAVVVRTVASA